MAPSTQDWSQDLVCPDPGDHIVHLYFGPEELVRAVAYYAATGLELGEAVVLVMKPEHWRATRAELDQLGVDVDARIAASELVASGSQRTVSTDSVRKVSGSPGWAPGG